jgi:hypothetical protein
MQLATVEAIDDVLIGSAKISRSLSGKMTETFASAKESAAKRLSGLLHCKKVMLYRA